MPTSTPTSPAIQAPATGANLQQLRDELLPGLRQRKTDLEEQIRCLRALLNGRVHDQCFDRLDQAALTADRQDIEAKIRHFDEVAQGVDRDISWLQGSQFAQCQDRRSKKCAGQIEEEKLKLSPAAKQCIECTLTEREGKGKLH